MTLKTLLNRVKTVNFVIGRCDKGVILGASKNKFINYLFGGIMFSSFAFAFSGGRSDYGRKDTLAGAGSNGPATKFFEWV